MVAVAPETLGSFAIEHELGRGGSGVVYAARMGAAEVALKVLREDEAPTPKERERFLSEARNLARVTHPGVVRVVAVGELPDGRPYLAMERLRGATLAEKLMMARFPVDRALLLFEQLASAVGALHAAGLVHRDVKPENVMLTTPQPGEAGRSASVGDRADGLPSGRSINPGVGERLVLLDFGIARGIDDAASTTTQAGLQRGTPAYMAPERFFGARATVASDVYETAVVLYVMLTGELPWKDPRSPRDRMNPRPPSAMGILLPGGLERALMTALGPDPEHRPTTIEELVSGVRRAGWDGATQLASPSGAGPGASAAMHKAGGTTESVRPRKWLVAGGFAVAFAAAVGVAIVVAGKDESPKREAAAVTPVAVDAAPVPVPVPVITPIADASVVPSEPEPVPVPVPDRVPDPAPVTKRKVTRSSGTGTGTGTGTGSASSAGASLADCRKIAQLYCTDEFQETEGTLAGKLCDTMTKQVKDWEAFPQAARDSQADWCAKAYPDMAAAVAERLRQYKEGVRPP